MAIKAKGPWVLVKVRPARTRTASGLYLPEGNLEERLGHAVGTVLSAGSGKIVKDRRVPTGLEDGQDIVFRGHLKEANCPSYTERDVCFIHIDDIVGVLDAMGS